LGRDINCRSWFARPFIPSRQIAVEFWTLLTFGDEQLLVFEQLAGGEQTGSDSNDRPFSRQYASAENWREDLEVFRPLFQPTKKPTKLST
jgi:hypothetical protein